MSTFEILLLITFTIGTPDSLFNISISIKRTGKLTPRRHDVNLNNKKSQIPSTKLQINLNIQFSMTKT